MRQSWGLYVKFGGYFALKSARLLALFVYLNLIRIGTAVGSVSCVIQPFFELSVPLVFDYAYLRIVGTVLRMISCPSVLRY